MPTPKISGPSFMPPMDIAFIHITAPIARMVALAAPTSGHGLGSTRW
jgi:hypothetical protein